MDSSDCSFFRTNSTNEFSSPDIKWTLQRTTHSLHLVEQVAIHVCVTSMHDVWMLVNTGVGGSSLVNRSTRHEVAMILQRPAFVTRFSCYSDNIHVLFTTLFSVWHIPIFYTWNILQIDTELQHFSIYNNIYSFWNQI